MRNNKFQQFLSGLKNLLGVGIYLLLIGITLEVLTIVVNRYLSISITIPLEWKIILVSISVILCISGMIWFNKSLDLIGIHLAGGENRLMTQGPFNYVRHPLYATLLLTIPPILVILYENILFIVPWFLIYVITKNMVKIEERGLEKIFGEEYEKYKEFVPDLIPYKGAGGHKFREYNESKG